MKRSLGGPHRGASDRRERFCSPVTPSFGVKESLIRDFPVQPAGTPTPDGRDLQGRDWTRTRFDIVLAPSAERPTNHAPRGWLLLVPADVSRGSYARLVCPSNSSSARRMQQ